MAGFVALYRIRIPWLVGRGWNCRGRRGPRLSHADTRPRPNVDDGRKIDNCDTGPGGMVGIRASLFLHFGASANASAVLAHDGLARISFRGTNDIRFGTS